MTTQRFGIGVTSVQSAKPSYAYGSALQQFPLKSGAALGLLRANVSGLPKNAVITSAKVWVNQYDGPWSGAVQLTLLRHLASYTYKVTWNTKPAATTTASQSKTGAAKATWWSIDVTNDVQAFVAGTKPNYGWRLATNSSTLHKMRSQKAAASQPYLEVTYAIPSKVPTDMAPQGGAVSVDKPILTFTCGDDTTAIQVQIDPDSDATSPAFDSGEVPATAGVLDLADTAYAGLADGDTTTWRARALGDAGWSGWSVWAEFSRSDLGTVDITSPIATPADGTPPFEWTYTGTGTQTAYEATLLDVNGKVLSTSGLVSGTDTAWTPGKGLPKNGDQGTARVRVHDDVTRIASPGQPVYAEASVDFTVTLDGTVDPMDTLTASQDPNVPAVNLAGTRAGGVPDEIVIFRDGVQVARIPGTDAFTGTAFAWTDWTAPMNQAVTYKVAPVVDGAVASTGPTVGVTPVCQGFWLVDPATGTKAVLWDVDTTYDQTDLVTLHTPIDDDAPPVLRRLRRGVYSGSPAGNLIDALGFDVTDTIDALDEIFPGNDVGTVYRLIDGHKNIAVIACNFLVTPTMQSGPAGTIARGSFSYWSQ